MSELDATTGMPGLPEGYFWRVSELNYWHGQDGCYQVNIMETVTNRTITGLKGPWFHRRTVTVKLPDKHNPVASKPIGRFKPGEITYNGTYPKTINDAMVASAARQCLIEWNRERDRLTTIERICGDYPPKQLGTTA